MLTNQQFKDIRLYLGLTQQNFAEKLGVSVSTVKLVESGRMQVSANIEAKVAKHFQATPEFFEYLANKRKLSE